MEKHFLQARREALKMSQAELAAAIGVERSVYARWERGRRAVPEAWREKVGVLLDLDVALLEPAEKGARAPSSLDDTRHRVRRRYPIGGTLDDVLRLGRHACAVVAEARRVIGDAAVQRLVEHFARDTKHELLLVLTVAAFGGRPLWTSPMRFDCPLLVLDDFRSEYGGDQMQWAVLWEGDGEYAVFFGQVRVKTIFQSTRARADFLVYHKARGRRGQCTLVELDGSHHATQPSQDEERAENLLVPTIRYDNQKLLTDTWFPRFLNDLRTASERGARLQARRDADADQRRREREAQLRQRLAEM